MVLPSVCCTVTFDRFAVHAARCIANVKGWGPPSRSHGRTAESRGSPEGAPFPAIGENILTTGVRGKNRPRPRRAQEGSKAASGPAISS